MTQCEIPALEFWDAYLATDTHIVIVRLDVAGNVLCANAALGRLLDLRNADVVGRRIDDLLVAESAALLRQVWPPSQMLTMQLHFAHEQILQTLGCTLIPARQYTRHNGQPTNGHAPRANGAGHPSGAWLIGEADIRELNIIQRSFVQLTNELTALSHEQAAQAYQLAQVGRALERRNEELDAFTRIVSHDLKAPLRTFRVFTRMLQQRESVGADEEARRYLDLMATAADRLNEQIEYLLRLARAGQALDPQPDLPLESLVAELVADLSGFIAERQAEVTVVTPLPTIWGDRQRLRGVLQNLIVNGINYNQSAQPRVELRTAQVSRNTATIAIRDNGIGIAAEDLDRIWLPFQRGGNAADHSSGHGLGLAFCRRVVEAHGGEIRVESEPGRGTTMLLTLPRIPPA